MAIRNITEEIRELRDFKDEHDDRVKQERKELFVKVAVATIGRQEARECDYAWEFYWQPTNTQKITDSILKAAEKFSKKPPK